MPAKYGGLISVLVTGLGIITAVASAAEPKYPLGDRPLTEEERAWLDARVVKINEIEPNDLSRARAMAELGDGLAPLAGALSPPSSVDNSLLKYFPPIGNQGGLNSCAAVHACHYFASYSQAQDYNKDIRAGNYDDLMSPAFIYNTMNGNANRATSVPLSVARLCDIGACSRSLMPYDGSDYWTWPSEAAWVDALTNRMDTTYQVDMNTQAGIDAIKQRLANGDIAETRFTVRTTFWSYPSDANGINNKVLYWQTPGDVGGHGCTLVGYDDNRSYVDHRDGQTYYGAFLCANSWGQGWGTYNSTGTGTKGFYWVAYRMFLEEEFGPDVYYNSDRRDYKPKVYAVTGMNHTRRGFLVHSGGIGPTGSPLYETPEALEYDDRDDAGLTDTDRVAVDLTDGVPFLQANGSNTLFVRTENRHFSIPGTVTSADFYVDLDRTGVYQVLSSTDPAYTIWAGQTLYAQVELVLPLPQPALIHEFTLDSDPGWIAEGAWAWGQPTGSGGEYGGPDPTSGYTGNNVYGYNLYGDYDNDMAEMSLTTTAIDCRYLKSTMLKFRRWLGVEQPIYDHAYLKVSTDNINWDTIVWQNTGEITETLWSLREYDISSVADGEETVYIRWVMGTTDGGWMYCGWNIDDIEIWGLHIDVTITLIERSGEDVIITWDSEPGTSYTVQWSTDGSTWNDVSVGETNTWTDTSVSGTVKFYRVIE